MREKGTGASEAAGMRPYLSPLAVWALSVGSAIGWGSLVVTSRTYLSQAGPLGSVLGLLIGFGMMLMVAHHYQNPFCIVCGFPDTPGRLRNRVWQIRQTQDFT